LESKKIYPVSGVKKMSDIKMLISAKDIIRNAINMYKMPWMPRAKAVLRQAEKQSNKEGYEFFGTEHILFGVMSVKDSLAAKILKNLKITSSEFEEHYKKLRITSQHDVKSKKKLIEHIYKVIQCGYEQATEWAHTYIGTEHLLIGILKAKAGAGFQILTDLGITLEKVCEETKKLIVCRNTQSEREER
jgi:ATP-dependent Clp protease ATP-binding subunit ClpC